MLANIVNYVLGLGAAVFLPIIMLILGLALRMKVKEAFPAALTLGVAFTGMSLVINFMSSSVGTASQEFIKVTGLNLKALDLGWTAMASIAWAWPYAFLMFPLQIIINIVMLALGWTECLNVDMWNVWNKVLIGALVFGVSGSLPLAFVFAAIEVVFELKNADLTQKTCYKMTKIPGIACPHPLLLTSISMYPVNRLLDLIPGLKGKTMNADKLREKIGIFGENHVMGFILGAMVGIFAHYSVKNILILAVQAATAMLLMPMVAKLFMTALAPFSDAAGNFMKKRFPGRDFYIGLDHPFLLGQSEAWVTIILLVPVALIYAVCVGYWKYMSKRNHEIDAELEEEEAA